MMATPVADMRAFLNAALWYGELGHAVFPCAPGRKAPRTEHGLLEATTDAELITAWWTQHPDANVALRTDGLVVIDIDGQGNAWLADELAKLLGGDVTPGLTDPDEVPEPPDEAITQRGDLWILGEHRLLCGDSASAADVDVLLAVDPAKALELPAGTEIKPKLLPVHLVNTDPPYNVRVEPRSNNAIAAEQTGRRAYLMELDPLYCDVIVQRWEKFTGRKAERQTLKASASA